MKKAMEEVVYKYEVDIVFSGVSACALRTAYATNSEWGALATQWNTCLILTLIDGVLQPFWAYLSSDAVGE